MGVPTKKKTSMDSCGVDMKGGAAGIPKKMMKKDVACRIIASSVEVRS